MNWSSKNGTSSSCGRNVTCFYYDISGGKTFEVKQQPLTNSIRVHGRAGKSFGDLLSYILYRWSFTWDMILFRNISWCWCRELLSYIWCCVGIFGDVVSKISYRIYDVVSEYLVMLLPRSPILYMMLCRNIPWCCFQDLLSYIWCCFGIFGDVASKISYRIYDVVSEYLVMLLPRSPILYMMLFRNIWWCCFRDLLSYIWCCFGIFRDVASETSYRIYDVVSEYFVMLLPRSPILYMMLFQNIWWCCFRDLLSYIWCCFRIFRDVASEISYLIYDVVSEYFVMLFPRFPIVYMMLFRNIWWCCFRDLLSYIWCCFGIFRDVASEISYLIYDVVSEYLVMLFPRSPILFMMLFRNIWWCCFRDLLSYIWCCFGIFRDVASEIFYLIYDVVSEYLVMLFPRSPILFMMLFRNIWWCCFRDLLSYIWFCFGIFRDVVSEISYHIYEVVSEYLVMLLPRSPIIFIWCCFGIFVMLFPRSPIVYMMLFRNIWWCCFQDLLSYIWCCFGIFVMLFPRSPILYMMLFRNIWWCCFRDLLSYIWCCFGIFVMLLPRSLILYMMLFRNISWCCFRDLLSYIWSCVRIFRDVASEISYLIYDVVSEYLVMLLPRSPILFMMLFRNISWCCFRDLLSYIWCCFRIFRDVASEISYRIYDVVSEYFVMLLPRSPILYMMLFRNIWWCCFRDLLSYLWCCFGIFRDVVSEISYHIYEVVSEYFVMLLPRSPILFMMLFRNIWWCCFRDLLSYLWCCFGIFRDVVSEISYRIYDVVSEYFVMLLPRSPIVYMMLFRNISWCCFRDLLSYIWCCFGIFGDVVSNISYRIYDVVSEYLVMLLPRSPILYMMLFRNIWWCFFRDLLSYIWFCFGIFRDVVSEISYHIYEVVSEYFVMLLPRSPILYMMLFRNISWCCFRDLLSYIWCCFGIFGDVASEISYLIYDVVSEYFVMLFPRSPIVYMMLFRNIWWCCFRDLLSYIWCCFGIFGDVASETSYRIYDVVSEYFVMLLPRSPILYMMLFRNIWWCCFRDLLSYIWCCFRIFRDVASEISYLIYDVVSEYLVMLLPRPPILYMMLFQNISWCCFRDLLSYIWCCFGIFGDVASEISYLIYDVVSEYLVMLLPRPPIVYMMLFRNISWCCFRDLLSYISCCFGIFGDVVSEISYLIYDVVSEYFVMLFPRSPIVYMMLFRNIWWCCFRDLLSYIWCCFGIFGDVASETSYRIYDVVSEYFVMLLPRSPILYMMLFRNIWWCCFRDLLSYIWCCFRIFRDVASEISYLIYDVVSEYLVMLLPRPPILYMMLFQNISWCCFRDLLSYIWCCFGIFGDVASEISYLIYDVVSEYLVMLLPRPPIVYMMLFRNISWCCFRDLLSYISCCFGIFGDVVSEISYLIYDVVSEYFVMLFPRSPFVYMMLCQNIWWCCFRDLLSYLWCCFGIFRDVVSEISYRIYDVVSEYLVMLLPRSPILYMMLFRNIWWCCFRDLLSYIWCCFGIFGDVASEISYLIYDVVSEYLVMLLPRSPILYMMLFRNIWWCCFRDLLSYIWCCFGIFGDVASEISYLIYDVVSEYLVMLLPRSPILYMMLFRNIWWCCFRDLLSYLWCCFGIFRDVVSKISYRIYDAVSEYFVMLLPRSPIVYMMLFRNIWWCCFQDLLSYIWCCFGIFGDVASEISYLIYDVVSEYFVMLFPRSPIVYMMLFRNIGWCCFQDLLAYIWCCVRIFCDVVSKIS